MSASHQVSEVAEPPVDWWLIGDVSHSEFSWGPLTGQRVQHFATLAELVEKMSPAEQGPRFGVVLWTERPGLIDLSLLEPLLARLPLIRWIQVVGAWCEGELRTGKPVTGLERIRWTDFSQESVEHFSAPGAVSAFRPRSWSPIERWLEIDAARLSNDVAAPSAVFLSKIVAIEASNRSAYEPLAELVCAAGAQSVWVRGDQVSGDAAQFESRELVAWIRDLSGFEGVSFWPLAAQRTAIAVGFPRVTEWPTYREHASLILTKPYAIAPLREWLMRINDRAS